VSRRRTRLFRSGSLSVLFLLFLPSFPSRSSSPLCCVALSAPHSFPTRRSSDLCRRHRVLRLLAHRRGCARHDTLRTRLELCRQRSEEHTSELQSRFDLVCRLLLEKKKTKQQPSIWHGRSNFMRRHAVHPTEART